ncbi:MAG: helix-turn-helix domain-containing protein, partial [Candidatus Binatia bacterium]
MKTQTAVKVRRRSASATKRSTFEKKYPLWDEYAAKVIPAERRAELQRSARRKLIEMDLRELRKFAGRTQVELAEATKMTQAQVSRLEKRPDHLLSTLR